MFHNSSAMFRSHRQMDAALTKARVKAKRSQVKSTASALPSSHAPVKQKGKDPGVPNLSKVKAALSRRAEREQQKEDRRNRHTRDRPPSTTVPLASLPPAASASTPESSTLSSPSSDGFFTSAEPSDTSVGRRWYMRELREVIAESDIVLEVLDARDPLGCRNPSIEQSIITSLQSDQSSAKRLVLVLNKIDLISPATLQAWLTYLKRSFPVVAFKSSTQQQTSHLNRHEPSTATMSSSSSSASSELGRSGCVGASALLQLLKNYSRVLKMKRSITVGVIGVPNVGKSSLINSLKRSRAVAVGNRPGVTKALQRVRLDAQVTLIDSPGVIAAGEEGDERMLLRNVLSVDQLSDPIASAQAVIRHATLQHVLDVYGLGGVSEALGLLAALAKKQGKLLAGGVPNVDAAARVMLQDLNAGKIRYETQPPLQDDGAAAGAKGDVEIVREWAKEFDVDALLRGAGEVRVEREDGQGDDDHSMDDGHDEQRGASTAPANMDT